MRALRRQRVCGSQPTLTDPSFCAAASTATLAAAAVAASTEPTAADAGARSLLKADAWRYVTRRLYMCCGAYPAAAAQPTAAEPTAAHAAAAGATCRRELLRGDERGVA